MNPCIIQSMFPGHIECKIVFQIINSIALIWSSKMYSESERSFHSHIHCDITPLTTD